MKLADINTEDLNLFVGLLTIDQKDQLLGQLYTSDSYFNPIQDANDNWVVSVEEIQNNTNPDTFSCHIPWDALRRRPCSSVDRASASGAEIQG